VIIGAGFIGSRPGRAGHGRVRTPERATVTVVEAPPLVRAVGGTMGAALTAELYAQGRS
jgi:hypothetical protein